MDNPLEYFTYEFIDNKAEKTLFLFHGTGGDEHDLLPLAKEVGVGYNLVGLRGNVKEQGMNRFFRRFASGVFDLDNVKEEVEKLQKFLAAWFQTHYTSAEACSYLGYSNGANMILASLFTYPEIITTAIVLHGMLPFQPNNDLDLTKNSIFVSFGSFDQMITPSESQALIDTLKHCNAAVEIHEYSSGHELTHDEVLDLSTFLSDFK